MGATGVVVRHRVGPRAWPTPDSTSAVKSLCGGARHLPGGLRQVLDVRDEKHRSPVACGTSAEGHLDATDKAPVAVVQQQTRAHEAIEQEFVEGVAVGLALPRGEDDFDGHLASATGRRDMLLERVDA